MSLAPHVSVRLDQETLARLRALAEAIQRPGDKPLLSEAIRAALHAGLPAIEARYLKPAPPRAPRA